MEPGGVPAQILTDAAGYLVFAPIGPSIGLPPDVSLPAIIVVSVIIVVGISLVVIMLARCLASRNTAGGRLMRLTAEEATILVPATFCLFASTGLQMLIPLFGGRFIQLITTPEGIHGGDLRDLMISIIVVSILMSIFSSIRGGLYELAGERVICRLRKRVFAALLKQEIAFFDEQTSGALVSRLTSDTTTLQNAASSYVSMGCRSAAQFVVSLIILFVMSWKLTLTMLGVVPAVSILAGVMMRILRKVSEKYQEQTAEAGKVAGEALGNMRTVRVFLRGEEHMTTRYNNAAQSIFVLGSKRSWIYGAWNGIVGLLFYMAFTVVLWVGASLVDSGELKASTLVQFILYTLSLSMSIMMLGSILPQIGTTMGATAKVFSLIDRVPGMADGGLDPGEHCGGLVEFEKVTFSYATRREAKVLDDVSFVAQPNQVVALVGPSGSGKSSCISLTLRLYDVAEGAVRIDGHDVRNLRRDWLRSHITVVSQEPVLFAASARENIKFGLECTTEEELIKVAKLANCHDFIMDFPDKYDTLVGERGIQLSGGQKQRVAIARALITNPTILLLDEATSALDAESERIVQEALNSLLEQRKGRTSIVVAHRLSTVRNSDLIIVLSNGCVKESGTHTALLEKGGVYKDLVQRQLQNSALEDNSKDAEL